MKQLSRGSLLRDLRPVGDNEQVMSEPRSQVQAALVRRRSERRAGEFMARHHPAGELIEADQWTVIEEREGLLRVRAHVPAQVKNLHNQLFGGFTPTYIHFAALCTVANPASAEPATINMRIDYFEPIVGPEFIMESRVIKRRAHTTYVETRLFDPPDTLAVVAQTTLRDVDGPLAVSE